ncbi:unnamed protein product [Trichobilharzia szidati]|nr:unnamed protein product [Trichobilharzia szidati]
MKVDPSSVDLLHPCPIYPNPMLAFCSSISSNARNIFSPDICKELDSSFNCNEMGNTSSSTSTITTTPPATTTTNCTVSTPLSSSSSGITMHNGDTLSASGASTLSVETSVVDKVIHLLGSVCQSKHLPIDEKLKILTDIAEHVIKLYEMLTSTLGENFTSWQDHETPLNLTQPKLSHREKDVNGVNNSTSSVQQQLYDTISNSLNPQNLTYPQSAKSLTNTSLFPPVLNIPSTNPLIQMTQSMPWLQQKSADQLTNGLMCPTNDSSEMMMPSERNLTPFFNWLSTFPDVNLLPNWLLEQITMSNNEKMSTNPMTHSPSNNNNSNNAFTETMLNYMKCYYAKLSSNQTPSEQYQMEIGQTYPGSRKTSHASNKEYALDNQQLSIKNSIEEEEIFTMDMIL